MKTRTLLLGACASLALAASASASTDNHWYVGIAGGGNWIDNTNVSGVFDPDAAGPNLNSAGSVDFDTGWAVLATVGYGFAPHWRAEFEAGYRQNDFNTASNGHIEEWSPMLNVLYDIPVSQKVKLSIGAGAGAAFVRNEGATTGFSDDTWAFAYQGIAGLSYALTDNLDLTLDYHYFRVSSPDFQSRVVGPAGSLSLAFDDIVNHTATLGLRYAFGAEPAPEPMVAAPPPPPPPAAPEAARQFIIFFGFNKCNITAEADGVLSQAATSAKDLGSASIQIVGHTDTSGSPKYNQKLSECRANAAKKNLVGKGVAASAITASGKGESELMVQTADGVKEPQNRRAQVDLN